MNAPPGYRRLQGDELDRLLRPSLAAADDIGHIDRPWNPANVVLASFFTGPIGGAILFSLNSRRLGMRGVAWRGIAAFAVIAAASIVAGALVSTERFESSRRAVRISGSVVTLVTAILLSRLHRRRYAIYSRHGGDDGKLFWIAVAVAVLSVVAHTLLLLLVRGALA